MKITRFFVLIFVVAVLAGGALLWSWWYKGQAGETTTFVVQKGENYVSLGHRLEQAGIISNARAYRWYVNLFANGHVLKRGEYALAKGMSVATVVDTFLAGRVIEHPFTIPEGVNLFQVAEHLEQSHLGHAEAFIAAARDPALLAKLPTLTSGATVPKSAEGYLFPDTYALQRVYTEREILQIFLERFTEKYKTLHLESLPPHLQALAMTPHDLITLASMVEKETGAAKERPVIASVFLNRLQKHMRLQSDPTTIYGIWVDRGMFDGNLHKADLTAATPYNTYTVPGLPAGPIANPGLEAIRAILHPADSPFLFFVSNNDGTHSFAVDYKTHAKNVDRLQKNPEARGNKSWRDLPKDQRANHGS